MADRPQATAQVATDAAARYAKQLASHLGRRAEVRNEEGGTRLVFTSGTCFMRAGDAALELTVEADDTESLNQWKDVVARHLERFGQRNELKVDWQS